MIYLDYIAKQDKVYVITAVELFQSERAPYELEEFIKTTDIHRLDIYEAVLKSETSPMIDESYHLTELGKNVMSLLARHKAYPYPKGYAMWKRKNIQAMICFHFHKNISQETFNVQLTETLKTLNIADPIRFFKEYFLILFDVNKLRSLLNDLIADHIWTDSLNVVCWNNFNNKPTFAIRFWNCHTEYYRTVVLSTEKFINLITEIILSYSDLNVDDQETLLNLTMCLKNSKNFT